VVILDTDTLSIIQRGRGPEYENLATRLDAVTEEVVVSIISFEEQMRGWLAFIARANPVEQQIVAYAKLHALLDDFITRPIVDFDDVSAAEFERLRSSKVRIGTMDLKIAAIALAHNALLLSRNLTDFRKVPDLRVDDWTAPS
jgi:tRNA(fMet)-specific endonuclease VapC